MIAKIVWLMLWILSLVVISYFGGAISYGLFFALTLVPVVAIISLLIMKETFKIYQELESRVVKVGEPTDYHFILQNTAPFAFPGIKVSMFPDFYEVSDMPQSIEYELLPGENVRFDTKLTCKYRGEYEVGVKYVVLTDCFRLFKIRYNLMSVYKASVKPKIIELEKLQSLENVETLIARETHAGLSYPDVVVRDYIRGDSMKLIHWKASAKTGDLKVRTFYDESKQGVDIFLNQSRYGEDTKEFLPLENKMLEIVIALTGFFVYKNIPVTLNYGNEKKPGFIQVNDPKGFEPFYEKISNINFLREVEADELTTSFINHEKLNPGKIVFFVVHEVTEKMLFMTDELVDMGSFVIVYLVNNENVSYEAYSNERRQIIRLTCEEEIDTVL